MRDYKIFNATKNPSGIMLYAFRLHRMCNVINILEGNDFQLDEGGFNELNYNSMDLIEMAVIQIFVRERVFVYLGGVSCSICFSEYYFCTYNGKL